MSALGVVLTFYSNSIHGQQESHLISHEFLGQTSSVLISFVSPLPAQHNVRLYKITYHTVDVHGEPTVATGAVAVPVASSSCNSFPVIAYCHGTVLRKYDVPSEGNYESTLMLAFASSGYIVVAPDYLGLGDNPGLHPYVHAASEATATIDAIRAGQDLLLQLEVTPVDELFVTGYSQGGQSAMETAKYIQENDLIDDLHLVGAAPMSGPYNLSGSQAETILSGEPYSNPGYIIYLLYSYQMVYGNLFEDLGDVIQSPYDTLVPPFFDGVQNSHDMSDVDALLPTVIDELFVDTVLTNLHDNPDHPLWANLRDNDNFDWVPEIPLRMYYCGQDEQVPAANSVSADSVMNANGALDVLAVNVNNNGTHSTCVSPAVSAAYSFFDSLSVGCGFITGLADFENPAPFRMYPNPATVTINVDFIADKGVFRLYTTKGERVLSKEITPAGNRVDVGHLRAGTYVAEMEISGRLHRDLVVIVR